jgi:Response regulator containing a CheY-like receiver domain and an HTH DNA-binding domain
MNPLSITPSLLPGLVARLTPRQLEIVGLLAEGHSNKTIAAILSINWLTVRTHIHNACERLGVDNRIQLIVIFAMWKVGKVP